MPTAQTMCELIAIVRTEVNGWRGTPEDVWRSAGSGDLSLLVAEYDAARTYEAAQRGMRLIQHIDGLGFITETEEPL